MKHLKSLSIFLIFFFLSHVTCHMSHVRALEDPGDFGGSSWVDETTPENLRDMIQSEELSSATKTTYDLNVITFGLSRLVGGDPINEAAPSSLRSGGAIGGVTSMIAMMVANQPASGVEYVADIGRNLGIVSPVYAQTGFGFGKLSPILPIWRAFRDIAYLFFIVIFIVIGFAIMFRVKISPQAVMTIQSAVPRIIIALLLVTFSYAIIGFMIDLMYVLIAIIAVAFESTKLINPGQAQSVYLNANIMTLVGAFATTGIGAVMQVGEILTLEQFLPETVQGVLDAMQGIPLIGGLFNVMRLPGYGLLTLVLRIVLLFTFFKLFFVLLKAYIGVLMSIIFGPLQLLMGALPGRSPLGGWLNGIVNNLLVFPTVVTMFLLADVILEATSNKGSLWAPPFLDVGTGASASVVGGMIAYGIFLMTPKVVEMVNNALQIKPSPYGTGIGEAFGPVKGLTRGLGVPGAEYGYTRGADYLAGKGLPLAPGDPLRSGFDRVVGAALKRLAESK